MTLAHERAAAAAARGRNPERIRGPVASFARDVAWWARNRCGAVGAGGAIDAAALARARLPALVLATARCPVTATFLDHHRALGVDHFFCLLLGGDPPDGPDLSWARPASAAPAQLLATINRLAAQRLAGRWTLFLAANEMFVYPRMESRALPDLAQHLDDDRRSVLHALTVDMVGGESAEGLAARRATERWFDPFGYFQFDGAAGTIEVRGGPLARGAWPGSRHRAPTLNRIAFARWEGHHHFVRFRQVTGHITLNRPHRQGEVSISGALLRHGALTDDGAPAAAAAVGGGFEDERGDILAPTRGARFFDPDFMVAFDGSGQLVNLGLMSAGRWF